MATCIEAKDSRRSQDGDDPSAELKFNIGDTTDDSAARLILLATAPVTWTVGGKTLVQKSRSVEPLGDKLWRGVVTYGRRQAEKNTGESTYQFEIGGGGSAHVCEAIEQTAYGADAPDCGHRINVVRDAERINVEGVDIEAPTYAWSETWYLPIGAVTPAYKAILFGIAGAPVNNATWRGFNAGEVKFKGVSGQQRGEEDWQLTFKFEASPNVTGLTIGTITGIAKKGWEYLWVLFEDTKDAAKARLVPNPIGVYVAQVYNTSIFALLGIGG
jgi:hypothetical protein